MAVDATSMIASLLRSALPPVTYGRAELSDTLMLSVTNKEGQKARQRLRKGGPAGKAW